MPWHRDWKIWAIVAMLIGIAFTVAAILGGIEALNVAR